MPLLLVLTLFPSYPIAEVADSDRLGLYIYYLNGVSQSAQLQSFHIFLCSKFVVETENVSKDCGDAADNGKGATVCFAYNYA